MLLNLSILTFFYYISTICFTGAFFPYFIKGSAALIAFWHTKGGSSANFYHHDQTDTDEHAQFTSGSWQHHALIPSLWGWCRDTQAAEPLPLEANHSAPPQQVRHHVAGMRPASTPSKSGSWFKFIIHIVLATDSPGGSSSRTCTDNRGCSLLPYGLSPRFCQQTRCQTFRWLWSWQMILAWSVWKLYSHSRVWQLITEIKSSISTSLHILQRPRLPPKYLFDRSEPVLIHSEAKRKPPKLQGSFSPALCSINTHLKEYLQESWLVEKDLCL